MKRYNDPTWYVFVRSIAEDFAERTTEELLKIEMYYRDWRQVEGCEHDGVQISHPKRNRIRRVAKLELHRRNQELRVLALLEPLFGVPMVENAEEALDMIDAAQRDYRNQLGIAEVNMAETERRVIEDLSK